MSKSRVSQKSQLTPSSTKGSNAINLGKDSGGVEMGRKAQPSLTSGEIGVTQEVANIGGLSVIVGGNIDISPIDFGVNINPSEGTLAIATGAEIPGGLIGISGGIEINTNTGQVIGGSVGAEALGVGINVSNSSKGGLGVGITVQIPGTPIELSLGFGFPPKPLPTPTPTPTPNPNPPGVGSTREEVTPLLNDNDQCFYSFVYFQHPNAVRYTFDKPLVYIGVHPTYGLGHYKNNGKILTIEGMPLGYRSPAYIARVRASQSCLTKALKNLHHIVIVHRSPFDFLSQATLESCFLVYRIQREPSYQSEVLRTVEGTNAGFVFIKGHI